MVDMLRKLQAISVREKNITAIIFSARKNYGVLWLWYHIPFWLSFLKKEWIDG